MDMLKTIAGIWKGRLLWHVLKILYGINYDKVVVVLKEDDDDWNRWAMLHLQDYMGRKHAKEAVVLHSPNIKAKTLSGLCNGKVTFVSLSIRKLQQLMEYYCCYRFFYNIAFCVKDGLRDNHAEEILKKGKISKEELICLGFFHLRCVPEQNIR